MMDRSEKSLLWFDNNYNCSQSVFVAFAEELGIEENEALKIASAFGGGIGRQQLTCGALTGAAMTLGLKYGKGTNDSDEKKLFTYEKTLQLFDEFTKLHGSANCRQLLNNLDMRDEQEHAEIVGQNLFHVNCRRYVSDAVIITEKILNKG